MPALYDYFTKRIFFKYLCRVERKMPPIIFVKPGTTGRIEFNNYSNISKNKNGITKLIKMLDKWLFYDVGNYEYSYFWSILKMFEFLPKICLSGL